MNLSQLSAWDEHVYVRMPREKKCASGRDICFGLAATLRMRWKGRRPVRKEVCRVTHSCERNSYDDLVQDALSRVKEIQPWDLRKVLDAGGEILLVDVREPTEFSLLRIPGAINVPRGILEQSCEWDYDETDPRLAAGRDRDIVVVCRSGKRSILAADTMQKMGFANVASLRTGVRGWNDFEQPLVDAAGNIVDPDNAEEWLLPSLRPEQRKP
jgi:rhodanese-related sulfurtransferase